MERGTCAPRLSRCRGAAIGVAWALAALTAWAQAPPLAFRPERVGPEPLDRPTITNVQIVDLDGDGAADIVACDAQAQAVYAYRRTPDGSWAEQTLGTNLIAPAHATVVDLDYDGDNDVLVSVMGNLFPDDDVVGSLVLLENDGGQFTKRTLLDDVRRVVDAQPGDFDGDGDLDLAVAVFGYLRGQVLWLENRGDLQFRDHELLSAAGAIHVPVADYDGDGDLDIATIVSQEDEEAWGFENLGGGKFAPRRLWSTVNFDIGSAGLVATDLDGDDDTDLLLPVGDNLEDSYSIPQPYHGCLWLENKGGWQFAAHRIATFPGTYAAAGGDLDGDGDQDAVLVSMVNHWDEPDAPSLVWLENDGAQQFTQHTIATDPIMLVTAACGDVDGDDRLDVVAGGLHVYPPFDRAGRINLWLNAGAEAAPPSPAASSPPIGKPTIESIADAAPPLPDLSMVDPLTRRDLEDLHQRTADKVAAGQAAAADWLLLGQAYYSFGYFAAATPCFRQASELAPEMTYARYLLGVSLERTGELSAAVDEFRRLLTVAGTKEQRSIWFELGRCYLRLEDAASAEDAFVRANDHAPSLAQLAKLRIQAGRVAQAAGPLNALARLHPSAIEVYLLNARAATLMGDEKLAQQFRDRAEYNSDRLASDAVAQMVEQVRKQYGAFKLGDEAAKLIEAEKWEEAAATLREDFEASRNRGAAFHLAGAELECKRPDATIELLETFMKQRGAFPAGMVLLGDAYLAAGRADDALQAWEQTAEYYSAPELHRRLAQQYELAGRENDARRQQALALQATGIDQLRHSNPAAAKTTLESAVAKEPALPRAWFYLGECRRVLGAAAAARAAYGKTLEYAPNHGRALARLELVPE